jgi:hypothetical protein
MTQVAFDLGTLDGESLVAAGSLLGGPTAAPALVPNPVNIVRSSRIPTDDTDGRWPNGFSYLPEGNGQLVVYDECSNQASIVGTIPNKAVDWQPYVLSAQFQCSTFGFEANDYAGRAMRLLDAATPKMLEEELWNGTLAQLAALPNTYFHGYAGAGLTTDVATSAIQGLAECEQYLGDIAYGGRGTIHVPPYALPYLSQTNSLRREGNLLLTDRDTIVVPGSGYSKMSEAKAAMEFYATGVTDVRLSDIYTVPDAGNMAQSIDKGSNTVVVRAERVGIVSWDELAFFRTVVTLP